MSDLDKIMELVADVEGWMSDGQARLLWDSARTLAADDKVVEIGSFRGRSMAVLASAAPDGVELIAIDPHGGGDRGPGELTEDSIRGDADNATFWANLKRCGVADRVRLVRQRSDDAHSEVAGPIDLLYIDGAHRFGPARADIAEWGARVAPGGTMLIHDSFNSVGVTGAQVAELFFGKRFRYEGRSRSMTRYSRRDLSPAARITNALRQGAELPYFVWALWVKVMVSVGLGDLTRRAGNPEGSWPY